MKQWLLPAALAAAQVFWWPRDAAHPVVLGAIAVTIVTALLWRRSHPVPVLIAVCAANLVTLLVQPGDQPLVVSAADLVALFSVAARCGGRATAIGFAAALAVDTAGTAIDRGYPFELLGSAAIYGLAAALGHRRGRWVRARAEAADRLAEAEQAERDAATAERRRLARELHDVTAHHLTSIVVNASAAELLAAQRPELRPEAVSFAARTGQDTLAALHRLVELMPADELPPDRPQSLAGLAEAFRHLGQPVTADLPPGDPPPAIAGAAYGIAREALTNTLRYAPGRPVRLTLRYASEHADLVIDDDGSPGGPAVTGLGGGRGVTGMHDRAAALGGTVTAARRADGGWRVRAVLPLTPAARPAAPARPQWSPLVLDVLVVAGVLLIPLISIGVGVDEDGVTAGAATLLTLAALAHSAPLLWRRRHPWATLAAVAVTAWLAPLLVVVAVPPADSGWLFMFTAGTELAAVHAVAAWSTRPHLSWLSAPIAVASWSWALGVVAAAETPAETDPDLADLHGFAAVAVFAVITAVLLAVPAFLSWLAGHLARHRRDRRQSREEGQVAAAMIRAAAQARGERARVAAGLRDAVLQHAAQVPVAAGRNDLPAVITAARHALEAMRALLDGLSHTPTTPLAVPVASAVPGRAPARPAPAALLLGETPVTSGSVAPVVAAGEDAPTIEALD